MIFSANRRPLRRIMRYQILATAPLFPKFVSEGAAMYHELRKRGASRLVRIIGAADIDRALSYRTLADALAKAFRAEIVLPARHHHTIARPGRDATLLLMPAWTAAATALLGCKLVTVFPDNATRSSVPLRPLSSALRHFRRAARRARRSSADRLAHGGCFGACGASPRACRRNASPHGRRRRARAPPRARACGGAADPQTSRSGTARAVVPRTSRPSLMAPALP